MVQVVFQQEFVATDESSSALFSVIFAPTPTEIPFTFMVETFDFSPPDAQGWLGCI